MKADYGKIIEYGIRQAQKLDKKPPRALSYTTLKVLRLWIVYDMDIDSIANQLGVGVSDIYGHIGRTAMLLSKRESKTQLSIARYLFRHNHITAQELLNGTKLHVVGERWQKEHRGKV